MSRPLVDQYGKPFRETPSYLGVPTELWAQDILRMFKDNLRMEQVFKIQRLRESMPRAKL